jgi:hypothetical protein
MGMESANDRNLVSARSASDEAVSSVEGGDCFLATLVAMTVLVSFHSEWRYTPWINSQ